MTTASWVALLVSSFAFGVAVTSFGFGCYTRQRALRVLAAINGGEPMHHPDATPITPRSSGWTIDGCTCDPPFGRS